MIVYIKGILEVKLNDFVIVDVNGIGYKIFMSENSIEGLRNIGEQVKIYTYHKIREDEESLYGFLTMEELNMFELLLSVSGVGAKSALNVLANMEPSSFALAVITNDTSKLVKVPGLGNKTAARIILELKDKLKNKEIKSNKIENEKLVEDDSKKEEAISALQVLGYNKKDIEKVFEKVNINSLKLEDLIKQGLRYLARN